MNALLRCSTPYCTRTPKAEWAVCPTCADRLIASALRAPHPVTEPEWIRRMRTRGLPAKDLTDA